MKVALFIFILVVAIFLYIYVRNEEHEQLERYWDVKIGMTEEEMLNIMGDNYSRSLLKNNRTKYEWRIDASSTGYSYNGVSTRSYSGVKKVEIYVKDGYVEEVKAHNVT